MRGRSNERVDLVKEGLMRGRTDEGRADTDSKKEELRKEAKKGLK
jgi:hypothetical protein